jgi:hypothetical protein
MVLAWQAATWCTILDKYIEHRETNMGLEEIQASAVERRVKRMKDSAKSAQDRARQLKAQAEVR